MRETLPTPLRITRILLFVLTAVVGLQVIGGLLIFDMGPELLGLLVWTALPGIAALFLALRIPRGGRWILAAILVLQVFLLLFALGRIGNGDPQGLTNLLFPVLITVFVLQKSSRAFLTSGSSLHR
ncbi:hypothetical protein HNR23_001314 [Nocardiopsis mwathae]|uniref:Uncharacterized protein n=1 Tax=Nocardiopsis mwathae TaxID=1472723 RepID=A0A7W9YFQ8_9ACTN|nr:hypothetical protein [Nocardiopsis mwathae]MBB6171254.1 hypothetical protein [Nocardiopsis mwathae]